MAHDLGNACLGDANPAFPLFRLVSPLHHRLISNNYEAEWDWGVFMGVPTRCHIGKPLPDWVFKGFFDSCRPFSQSDIVQESA